MIKKFLSKNFLSRLSIRTQYINRLKNKISQYENIRKTKSGRKRLNQPTNILLYLNLPQDLDVLLPLIARLKESAAYPIGVSVSDKAWHRSPRIGHLLSAIGITPQVVSHKAAVAGLQPSISNVCAVITASESTANPHRGAHTLTQKANQKGIPTYTMQHGYENVGITYFDEEYPVGMITFASQKIFTWVPAVDIPAETPVLTRHKCVAVGCPKFVGAPELSVRPSVKLPNRAQNGPLIAVFENLHWGRYSDTYRQRFLKDLEQTAFAYPHITFLVKPHHTGLWLTKRYQGKVPAADNLLIADPQDPAWERFTAPALIEIANAVITTPSTVAIDAARASRRVAVTAYGMDLPNYEPLPLLRSQEDWRSLIHDIDTNDTSFKNLTATFLSAHLIPGDAVQRIIDTVTADINKQSASVEDLSPQALTQVN